MASAREPRVVPAGPGDLEACLAIRIRVFVDEQGVSRDEEIDGRDPGSTHWIARVGGRAAGTARLREVEGAAKAERVAVLPEFRGAGVGAALMRALEAEARRRGLSEVVLHAQVSALPFYEGLGYRAEGPVFQEAEIPHRVMRLALCGSARGASQPRR